MLKNGEQTIKRELLKLSETVVEFVNIIVVQMP
jgi:hypothetical protein